VNLLTKFQLATEEIQKTEKILIELRDKAAKLAQEIKAVAQKL
jgi:hypothetical protein